ncbi:tripartite tricarboxylate transporter permease [Paenibacillus xerothermodurans]|uniref:Tripartite tricarboxylate transporter permease n=1 Tax=Paenibacillus xerothermodurans TaxID=1977292 RepID=A0A2W1P0Z7_PAEXE|nr:tripartite tricarboxylate transporter permease [Paenibacillus xerothermodurans]PZE21412.1 tripartite tricarboxylate transporter permease [Paenibacillus xerothermodurans]
MESFFNLLAGFEHAITAWNLLYCLIGVTIGMLVGVMPGLGPTAGTAILIPLTFGMEPTSAIIMLSGIFYGAMYGGTITSVLINTPGEAASVITCLDGHQLAKQGRAGAALGVAGIGSFIGGTVAILGLAFIGPPVAQFALRFGPPEFFALMMVGLLMLIGLMGKSLVKGIIAAIIGLLLSLIGMDPVSASIRFTFDKMELLSGLDFVAVAMGLFGISEILLNAENSMKVEKPPKVKGLLPKREEWLPTMKAVGRGTGLGFLLGLIPGANAVIASLMSYSFEKKLSKDPSRFGKGAIEGVAGPETANNAYSGAALIPLFTLGIPSSPTVAVILGAFVLHGLTPGPQLFDKNPEFVWGVIASMFIGNLLLLIMNLPLAGMWAKVALVPYKILFPIILIVSVLGAYSVNNRLWDVGVMFFFGIVGYFMKKLDIPMAATVLTFVLGRLIETSLLQSLAMSDGSFMIFFLRPISAILMVVALTVLAGSIISVVKKKRDVLAADVEM